MTQQELFQENLTRRYNYIHSQCSSLEERQKVHQEYYLWLALKLGINDSFLPVPLDRIRQSKDFHLNDIPLKLWDNKHPVSRRIPLTMSDSVCILKAYARYRIDNEK